MRYACLDVGDERIGVALSDELGLLARPLETIQRVSGSASYERLAALVDEYQVETLVVGLPLLPDGSEGKQVRSTQAYVRGMADHLDLPIVYWDERDSSAIADEIMIRHARSKRKRRRDIDAAAAAVILQDFLDRHSEESSADG